MLTWKVYRDEHTERYGAVRMWFVGFGHDWTSEKDRAAGWSDRRDAAIVADNFSREEELYDSAKWTFGEELVKQPDARLDQIIPWKRPVPKAVA